MGATVAGYEILHDAVVALSDRDMDYAAMPNQIGFNRFDAKMGHALAEKAYGDWTSKDLWMAWRLTRKYAHTQLGPIGIDVTRLMEPTPPVDVAGTHSENVSRVMRYGKPYATVAIEGKRFEFAWGGAISNWSEMVSAVREIPGARFNGENKTWSAPVNVASIEAVTRLIARSSEWAAPFAYDDDLATALDELARGWESRIEASNAASGAIQVVGLKDGMQLRPFQQAGVTFASESKRTMIADEMGLGKSCQSIATVVHNQAFPAIVLCPASLKLNWQREFRMWVDKDLTIQIATGTKNPEIVQDVDVLIINYDIAFAWKERIFERNWRAVVLDESHAIKTGKSRRTKAVLEIMKSAQPEVRLLLTGTPVLNRPIELWTQLEALGYGDEFGGFWGFAKRYCDAQSNGYGMDFSGASNLDELNSRLRSGGMMIRRRKDDVLTELPPKVWATAPIEMTKREAKNYRNAERNLCQWIGERKAEDDERKAAWRREGIARGLQGKELGDYLTQQARAYVNSETARLSQSEQLVRFEALKQLAYEGKKAGIHQWITDFLENTDKKLVVFGWHREAVSEIADMFDAPRIQGGMKQADVEAGKERFQNDPECRLIVCNIAAGGVGHTLTAASDVAMIEFAWNPALMEQAADRCHRIGQRDSVTAWQLVASHPDGGETIDDEIVRLIEQKRLVVDATTDGLGAEAQISMLKELSAALTAREGNV